MKYQRAAFSFVELIIIVIFLGIFAVIAVPRFNYALISKQKAETTARKIVTDLRLTRRLAISNAANNTNGFMLALVPPSPYNSYEIINLGTLEVTSHAIDSDVSVSCPLGSVFSFGILGNLQAVNGTQITVSAEGKTFTITINPTTGMIKCVEN